VRKTIKKITQKEQTTAGGDHYKPNRQKKLTQKNL
jgi:hypothetical protein